MRRTVRGSVLAQVALLAWVLTACSESTSTVGATESSPSASASESAKEAEEAKAAGGAEAAESGGTVGPAGSACELPVTFDTAAKWKPEAVDTAPVESESGNEIAEELAQGLLKQGPFTAACEIDAKPAGNIGFIRVWTGEAGATAKDAQALLKEFVAAEGNTSKARYSDFSSDSDVSGAEVQYLYTSEVLEESKTERAFIAVTPEGPVVVHLGGFDTAEHEAMLPAYELAKRTLRTP